LQNFQLFKVQLQKGDNLYLYTDGYADQFGGVKGKKFKYRLLNELVLRNHTYHPEQQLQIMQNSFDEWKGELEQVDDVCVVGIKIT
jgi:serine phosphatase RsbU (regulator of sigma subunit)